MATLYNKIFPGYQPYQLVKRRKTNVSRTISVLVFRVLMYLENQSVSYTSIGLSEFHVHDALKERDHSEDQGVDGMMGSECIL
jgi:hypothetical protein